MKTPMQIEAGQRLRRARKIARLRVEDLAKAVGCSPSAVRNQENATNGMRVEVATRYAELLNVSPEWLLYGVGPGINGVDRNELKRWADIISSPPDDKSPGIVLQADDDGNASLMVFKKVPMSVALKVLAILEGKE